MFLENGRTIEFCHHGDVKKKYPYSSCSQTWKGITKNWDTYLLQNLLVLIQSLWFGRLGKRVRMCTLINYQVSGTICCCCCCWYCCWHSHPPGYLVTNFDSISDLMKPNHSFYVDSGLESPNLKIPILLRIFIFENFVLCTIKPYHVYLLLSHLRHSFPWNNFSPNFMSFIFLTHGCSISAVNMCTTVEPSTRT